MIHSIMRQAVFEKFFEKIIPFKDSDKQYDLVEIEKETDKEIQAGSKVKYLAETTCLISTAERGAENEKTCL